MDSILKMESIWLYNIKEEIIMIGQTISHYAPEAHPPMADKIIEKPRQKDSGQVGEVRNSPTPACVPKSTSAGRSVFQRVVDNFRIPACHINIKLAGRPLLFSGSGIKEIRQ